MKIINACKSLKYNRYLAIFFMVVAAINIIIRLIIGNTSNIFLYYGSLISYVVMFAVGLYLYFNDCNKYFFKFENDKLSFNTYKNKLTEIYYKDIDSHEIRTFEIILNLKDGRAININLDPFAYEQLRKIKQELLNYL